MISTDPRAHPRLRAWLTDDPADPGRWPLDRPEVQRLIAEIAPGSPATDLGGVMSLNAHLQAAGLVLRVHQPFVTRARLLAQHALRSALGAQGLLVPPVVAWRGRTAFRCGRRWAELDGYLPGERLPHALDAYLWLFEQMGVLHRVLARLDLRLPRPLAATYAPPGTVDRWLPVTGAAVRHDPQAAALAERMRATIATLRRRWVPASALPIQLVHGDVRHGNVRRAPDGRTVFLDFGFAARRPRVHDLAYTLFFMVLALAEDAPGRFPWHEVPRLVATYEAAAGWRLTLEERRALVPYAAAVPLFAAALDGFTEDPTSKLRGRADFLSLGEYLSPANLLRECIADVLTLPFVGHFEPSVADERYLSLWHDALDVAGKEKQPCIGWNVVHALAGEAAAPVEPLDGVVSRDAAEHLDVALDLPRIEVVQRRTFGHLAIPAGIASID